MPFLLRSGGLLFAVWWMGCVAIPQAPTGEVLYAEKKYADAAQLLRKEWEQASDRLTRAKKAFLIAEAYRYCGQWPEAEQWYDVCLSLQPENQKCAFLYASALKVNEKYEQAVQAFSRYIERYPFDEWARVELEMCALAMQWKKNPLPVDVSPLESINTPALEYAPVVFKKNALVFTSDREQSTGSESYGWTGRSFSDLFVAALSADHTYTNPISFSEVLNSPFNEGTACFSADFKQCFFTRCGSAQTADDYCQIYFSSWENNQWTDPVRLDLFADTGNVQHPFLTADGKLLYFSSDVAIGFGGKDLYVSERQPDGSWGPPQNLGSTINTEGDEVFPVIGPDDRLYFASNGHPTMGGFDLFVAHRLGNRWGNVQNLRPPFNSGADDLSICFQPLSPAERKQFLTKGFFASNRPGGKGNDDLYAFAQARKKVILLVAEVVEKIFVRPGDPNSGVKELRPLSGHPITVRDVTEGATEIVDEKTYVTDAGGSVSVVVSPNRMLKVTAAKTDYFTRSETIPTTGLLDADADTIVLAVRLILEPIVRDVEITISNIYYDYDKASLRADALPVLDTLAGILIENPTLSVEIGSHTDSRGNSTYNLRLSQARAQSVVNYLVSKGVDAARLSARGYGESQLVNACADGVPCSEEQHQQNRRTTFKVLSPKTSDSP